MSRGVQSRRWERLGGTQCRAFALNVHVVQLLEIVLIEEGLGVAKVAVSIPSSGMSFRAAMRSCTMFGSSIEYIQNPTLRFKHIQRNSMLLTYIDEGVEAKKE